jgi:hypothetical protein
MKRFILLILIFALGVVKIQAQKEEDATMIGQYTLKLNSSVLGALLKPKDVIKVNLPENTKSWFYIFTASLNEDNSEIFRQFSSAVINTTSVTSSLFSLGAPALLMPALISKIKIPTGEAGVSIYCLDEKNASTFLNSNNFNILPFGGVNDVKQGQISITDKFSGSIFLGIKNTSSLQRVVYVSIQIYAITEKNISSSQYLTNGWSIENKRRMYMRWYNNALSLGLNKQEASDKASCTQKNILNKYSFSDYGKMGQELWDNKVIEIFNQCLNN